LDGLGNGYHGRKVRERGCFDSRSDGTQDVNSFLVPLEPVAESNREKNAEEDVWEELENIRERGAVAKHSDVPNVLLGHGGRDHL